MKEQLDIFFFFTPWRLW